MPCTNTMTNLYAFNYNASGSSLSVTNINAGNTNLDYNTIMFGNRAIIKSGNITANKIFAKNHTELKLSDSVKISGNLYVLSEEDYNAIWWTWTDSGMNKYIAEHNLKPVYYNKESLSAHQDELYSLYNQHYMDQDVIL